MTDNHINKLLIIYHIQKMDSQKMDGQQQIDTFLSLVDQLDCLIKEYTTSKESITSQDLANKYEEEIEKLGDAEDYAGTRMFIHDSKWAIGLGISNSLRECLSHFESKDIAEFIIGTTNLIQNMKEVINKYKAMTC